jgi:transcriptional regulator with XRE-family HTH domain
MNQIGIKIKNIRELRNYTQEFMAKSLKMTQAGYSKIECGDTDVNYSKLEEIAKVLGVSLEELVSFDQRSFFNHLSNVKGNNNGITINDTATSIAKLYEDKIALLEKLLQIKDDQLKKYEDRYGDL